MTAHRSTLVASTPLLMLAACGADHAPRTEGQYEPGGTPVGITQSGCIASVSADDHDGNVPANAVDGDLGTRWSSAGKGSWIRADLVEAMDVCDVEIAWWKGNERRAHFSVEASDDGVTWTEVFAGDSSGTTTQPERYGFSAVNASSVRVTVDGNTKNDWASISELGIVPCSDDPTIASVVAGDDDGNVPANAIDGDLGTRWSSLGKGSWIEVDLGAVSEVAAVEIAWFRGDQRSNAFTIDGSPDGMAWTELHEGDSSGDTAQPERYAFASADVRYVRITVNGNTSNDWASISELAVRGPAPACAGGGGGDDGGSESGDDGAGDDGPVGNCDHPDVDENGVAYLPLAGFTYTGGVERFDWHENFKSNGSMRHDFEGTPEVNQCVLGYFLVDGPDDEEISAKLGGGPHSDNHPKWADTHDIAITNFAGDRARVRWEATHPDYDAGPSSGIDVGDVRNKWVGAMGCKLNLDDDEDGTVDRIWYVAWVDPEGLDAAGNPSNGWVQTLDVKVDVDDVELKSPEVPYVVTIGEEDEAQATMRIDDQDEDDYEYRFVAYRAPVRCEP